MRLFFAIAKAVALWWKALFGLLPTALHGRCAVDPSVDPDLRSIYEVRRILTVIRGACKPGTTLALSSYYTFIVRGESMTLMRSDGTCAGAFDVLDDGTEIIIPSQPCRSAASAASFRKELFAANSRALSQGFADGKVAPN